MDVVPTIAVPFCVVAFQEWLSEVLTLAPYLTENLSVTLKLSAAKVMFVGWSEEPLKTHTATPGRQPGEETNTTVSPGTTGEGKPTVAVEPPPEKEKLAAPPPPGVGVTLKLKRLKYCCSPACRLVLTPERTPKRSIPTTTTTTKRMPTSRRMYSKAPCALIR
jgi:hypothetical protein